MSTRKYLRDRRSYFKHRLETDPDNESYKKTVDEINFIFEKLKEYDIKR